MIISILSFIFVIGVLVFIHELGHFLAAKSVGVRVEKFYLGFNLFGLGFKKEYKGIDCLVNNAGVSVKNRGDLLKVSIDSYNRCLDTNTRGSFFLTQKIALEMLKRPATNGIHRCIIFITQIHHFIIPVIFFIISLPRITFYSMQTLQFNHISNIMIIC